MSNSLRFLTEKTESHIADIVSVTNVNFFVSLPIPGLEAIYEKERVFSKNGLRISVVHLLYFLRQSPFNLDFGIGVDLSALGQDLKHCLPGQKLPFG